MPRRSDLAASRRLAWFDWWLETPNDDEHGNIDTFARALIAVFMKHMNSDGWCKPGIRTIARQMGCSTPTATARIQQLERLGVVFVYRRNNAVSWYAAAFPEHHPLYADCAKTLTSCPWERPRRRRATVQSEGVNCAISGSQLCKDVDTNPGTLVTGAPAAAALESAPPADATGDATDYFPDGTADLNIVQHEPRNTFTVNPDDDFMADYARKCWCTECKGRNTKAECPRKTN